MADNNTPSTGLSASGWTHAGHDSANPQPVAPVVSSITAAPPAATTAGPATPVVALPPPPPPAAAPAGNLGLSASQYAPSTSSGPAHQTSAPTRSRRGKRTRMSTRIALGRDPVAAESDGAAVVQADESRSDKESAELVKGGVVGDAKAEVLEAGSKAAPAAEDLPMSENKMGEAPVTDFEWRARQSQRDAENAIAAEALYNQVLERDNQLSTLKTSLLDAEHEISRLNTALTDLNNDIYDDERGFAVQLDAAATKAAEDEQIIKSLRLKLSQSANTIQLIERARADLQQSDKDLTASLKAKEGELERLQAQNSELIFTINNPEPDPELEACKEELEQYEAFDAKVNEQLDQLLQGLVSNDDTFDKFDAITKAYNQARDSAERSETAREAVQSELDKIESQRPSLSLSPFTSVIIDPVTLPKLQQVSIGSQTPPPRLTLSKLTSVDDEPVSRPATLTAGTQTSPVKLSLSHLSSLSDEEPIIVDSPVMASTSSQTDPIKTVGTSTQTEPPSMVFAGTQTTDQKTTTAATQTPAKEMISALTQTSGKKMATVATQTSGEKMSSASTQTAKHPTASSNTQTLTKVYHSASAQTDLTLPPKQTLQALSQDAAATVKNDAEDLIIAGKLRRRVSVLSVLGNPLFLTMIIIMLAYLWDMLPRVIDNPEHWSMPGYQSDMYRRDLARVDFGTWLGVDRSFIG